MKTMSRKALLTELTSEGGNDRSQNLLFLFSKDFAYRRKRDALHIQEDE